MMDHGNLDDDELVLEDRSYSRLGISCEENLALEIGYVLKSPIEEIFYNEIKDILVFSNIHKCIVRATYFEPAFVELLDRDILELFDCSMYGPAEVSNQRVLNTFKWQLRLMFRRYLFGQNITIMTVFGEMQRTTRVLNNQRIHCFFERAVKTVMRTNNLSTLHEIIKNGFGVQALSIQNFGRMIQTRFRNCINVYELVLAMGCVRLDAKIYYNKTFSNLFCSDITNLLDMLISIDYKMFMSQRRRIDALIAEKKKIKCNDIVFDEEVWEYELYDEESIYFRNRNTRLLKERFRTPLSLQSFSRTVIRKAILRRNDFVSLEDKVHSLPIPLPQQNFLLFHQNIPKVDVFRVENHSLSEIIYSLRAYLHLQRFVIDHEYTPLQAINVNHGSEYYRATPRPRSAPRRR